MAIPTVGSKTATPTAPTAPERMFPTPVCRPCCKFLGREVLSICSRSAWAFSRSARSSASVLVMVVFYGVVLVVAAVHEENPSKSEKDPILPGRGNRSHGYGMERGREERDKGDEEEAMGIKDVLHQEIRQYSHLVEERLRCFIMLVQSSTGNRFAHWCPWCFLCPRSIAVAKSSLTGATRVFK